MCRPARHALLFGLGALVPPFASIIAQVVFRRSALYPKG